MRTPPGNDSPEACIGQYDHEIEEKEKRGRFFLKIDVWDRDCKLPGARIIQRLNIGNYSTPETALKALPVARETFDKQLRRLRA